MPKRASARLICSDGRTEPSNARNSRRESPGSWAISSIGFLLGLAGDFPAEWSWQPARRPRVPGRWPDFLAQVKLLLARHSSSAPSRQHLWRRLRRTATCPGAAAPRAHVHRIAARRHHAHRRVGLQQLQGQRLHAHPGHAPVQHGNRGNRPAPLPLPLRGVRVVQGITEYPKRSGKRSSPEKGRLIVHDQDSFGFVIVL
jgi:hypothetical protein